MNPPLSSDRIEELLLPYFPEPSPLLLEQLGNYLELLVKWNEKTNLTAIRKPEEMVRRHFGESLFTARHLPAAETLLDLGSGAGFPGLPIQLVYPELSVTLAESQNKKASFLREAVRVLDLKTQVWAQRAELLPQEKRFDVVTLRAVDNPEQALREARRRALKAVVSLESSGGSREEIPVPGSVRTVLKIERLFHVEQSG